MYYITLDLEWNQAYAQQALAVQKRLCCRLRGEVIQIGAVKLDRNMNLCGSYSVIVKPKYFKKLHRHVSELTGISQDQMNQGVSLAEAAESFRKWCGEDFAFLTWGPDDIPMLKENFNAHGISADWLETTYDLQLIFNRELDDGKKQRSLEYAMEHFEIPMTLPAHDALNDAYFTALVATRLDVKGGIQKYDESRGEYLLQDVLGDADAGGDGYVTVGELLEDDPVKSPTCPICKRALSLKDEPLHSRGQRYTYLYHCDTHGDLFLSLKLHRNFNETFRAKRTVTHATEEEIEVFRQKLREGAVNKKSRTRRSRGKKRSRPANSDVPVTVSKETVE